ncbi:hypothetical protein RHGRI_028142 [Rhododendron griersonianum]|uniref:GPI inositol-deacylase n=1 Tax=Rhododendron griersonianum TaxID=479676 RepID=A0AAV6IF41_9ERIC|nr:hypothetical protein RHGRI_028142 [Rhododendron griersonianum]
MILAPQIWAARTSRLAIIEFPSNRIQGPADDNANNSHTANPFGITSRPEESIAAVNPSFTDGVATKDIHIDPLTSVSIRIFLPDTCLDSRPQSTTPRTPRVRSMVKQPDSLESGSDLNRSIHRRNSYGPELNNVVNNSYENHRRNSYGCIGKDLDNGVYRGYSPLSIGNSRKLPLMLQFHGGGFVSGSNESVANDFFCRRIAKLCDVIVIAVGYRLAPENRYPGAFEDGLKVLHWLAKQANLAECGKSLGNARGGGGVADLRKSGEGQRHIADAFGASLVEPWLAAHGDPSSFKRIRSTISLRKECAEIETQGLVEPCLYYVARKAVESGRLLDPIKVVAQVLMYPFFIGSIPTHSEIKLANSYFFDKAMCILAWKLFLPEEEFSLDHPAANPLIPNREPPLKLMPPTLTVVAELDWMRDRAIAYSEALRKVNVDAPVLEYKDAVHEFATLDMLLKTPQAQACAEDIAIWVKKYISLRGWIELLSCVEPTKGDFDAEYKFPLQCKVRSLAAESDRAYQGGPLERTFYRQASLTVKEGGVEMDATAFHLPNQYSSMLDWFAVDLEGEHSAMDGRILEEHTEYVVYAIHRILDQYKDSRGARVKEGAAVSGRLPTSVILVGHSMGGFVARAAIIHPDLRKSAVETVLTLSSPHQSPPVALQPSLGHYYARVNEEWRKGYEVQTSRTGRYASDPPLSRIVVVSISGGIHDYQVRTKLESLDGIVPPSHGFLISSTAMKNVWLSMEHQVSHTLLSLMDPETGQPFSDTQKRLSIFMKMLHSGIPQSFNWLRQPLLSRLPVQDGKEATGSLGHTLSSCPSNVRWTNDGLERDLYIQSTTVTILAMDGRRRWLDIEKLGSNGKGHFILVTNLAPCSGIRLHLWPEKGKSSPDSPVSKRALEVTQKMVHILSGPAPRQIEPGSQTEQAPPSAVFLLAPGDMRGFRFLTISVAPSPTVSGRPPPAASMAVGQFFSPKEGELVLSPELLLLSMYSPVDKIWKEDHPLAFNMTFSISLGLLPIKLSLETTGCGIKNSALPVEEAGDEGNSKLCKLRCFPPVALVWDTISGLRIFPNLFSETVVVDSSSALWSYTQGSEKTNALLLVDPHCSYKASVAVSASAAAKRFLLVYGSERYGLAIFTISMKPKLNLDISTIIRAQVININNSASSSVIELTDPLLVCPHDSNLPVINSCQRVGTYDVSDLKVDFDNSLMEQVVRAVRENPLVVAALVAVTLVCFVHPALGLFLLLLSHALSCHSALSSHAQSKESLNSRNGHDRSELLAFRSGDGLNRHSLSDDSCSSSPDSVRSFGDTQLEMFHHRHGLLILHFLAALMFVPSLVAWLQRIGTSYSFPWFDSSLCIGVILHGVCDSKPEFNFFFPSRGREITLSFIYLLAGYYSYLSGLALAPYQAFYAMAAIGVISFIFRIIQKRNREKGEEYFSSSRKHSHRH